jgi:competence protein ComEC
MPWAVAAFALMPFGLETLALSPMVWGVDAIIPVASGGRLAGRRHPAARDADCRPRCGDAGAACALSVAGERALCGLSRHRRMLGQRVVGCACRRVFDYDGPPGGGARGHWHAALSSRRLGRFDADVWLRQAGQEEPPLVWPAAGTGGDGALACDGEGCIYRMRGHTVALVHDESALAEDCRAADVVVAAVPVRRGCPSAVVTHLDRFDLWLDGPHALW